VLGLIRIQKTTGRPSQKLKNTSRPNTKPACPFSSLQSRIFGSIDRENIKPLNLCKLFLKFFRQQYWLRSCTNGKCKPAGCCNYRELVVHRTPGSGLAQPKFHGWWGGAVAQAADLQGNDSRNLFIMCFLLV
jgi:hypothetical protein